jgi:hypothetical protein
MDIYVLWHFRTDEQGCDHDKMLGVFSTRDKAQQALDFLRDKSGFKDYPDGFEILSGAMDEYGLKEGFITVHPGEE